MIITKTVIPRRTMLRGLGATLALPLLDGMVPALTALSNTAAKPINRLGVVYVPNGIMMPNWTPATEGAGFEFTQILKPLESVRERVLVLSGLNSTPPPTKRGENGGVHARASTRFLTGVPPKYAAGSEVQAGISMDQWIAKELGQHTQLASLELGTEGTDAAGSCDIGFSCSYTNTIAWRSPTTPLPVETNPRAVFERLFGDSGSTDTAARLSRIYQDRSVLDSVTDKVSRLQRGLGTRDRAKLAEYLEAVRDIERRIQKAEEQSANELPLVAQPSGIPASFEEHVNLLFDLQLLAYQCDLTRVITFMFGREFSGRTYPEIGVPDAHHPTSHHQMNPEKLAKLVKINVFHMNMFARYVEKLRSTPDGDGSLLDHMTIVYGAGMSDSDAHSPENLPVLMLGGRFKGNRHVQFPKGTPLANLNLTLLDAFGIPAEKIGDSNGELEDIKRLSL